MESRCSGGDRRGPAQSAYDLDYIFRKFSRCVKDNVVNRARLCKYVDRAVRLSSADRSLSLDRLFYANDVIEFLAENITSEPRYAYHLKQMLTLCLMPPTVKSVRECSENPSTLIRFYDVMAKCIRSVRVHAELDTFLFGVIQSSVLRRQPVPENSVSLRCCYEAIEASDLPTTLMELAGNAPSRTFLEDLLTLSYNIAVVSDRSALHMMRADGVKTLVDALRPNFLSMLVNSHERLIVCKSVVLLLDQMFSVRREPIHATTEPPPRVTRDTLEVLLCNIKIETQRNARGNMKTRNDFCHVLAEIVENCAIDENEFSDEIVTDIVMLCVWPEIVHVTHWMDGVRFESTIENFTLKNIMLDVVNKVFVNLSRKPEYQQLTTLLMKEFMSLVDAEYAKNTYGDDIHDVLSRLLSSLPYLLVNSVDDATKNDCCKTVLALIKTLKCEERFCRTMVNAIACVGIASNDDRGTLRTFKCLKADVLINSVVLDTFKTEKRYDFRDIRLCGLNALNVFYRDNQHNPEVQTMVFNTVMRLVKLYFVDDGNADENIQLDLLHFIEHAIIRYDDQVEYFAGAGGIEPLLDVLARAKYTTQLVVLSTLVDLAAAHRSAGDRIKKWKSRTDGGGGGRGYLELMCEIWRREQVRFGFIDDELMFAEQRRRTAAEHLSDGRCPTAESMYLCAQPKIYSLFRSVEFRRRRHRHRGDDDGDDDDDDDDDLRERAPRTDDSTEGACRLVSGARDKATVAHVYHYYALKTGEVWLENELLSRDPDDAPSPVESQAVDVMTARHAYLVGLIKTIKRRVGTSDAADYSEIECGKPTIRRDTTL